MSRLETGNGEASNSVASKHSGILAPLSKNLAFTLCAGHTPLNMLIIHNDMHIAHYFRYVWQ